MERKDAKYKFEMNVLALSECKNINDALKEWILIKQVSNEKKGDNSCLCVCQHKIQNVYYIANIKTRELAPVGSSCLKKFTSIKTKINKDISDINDMPGEYSHIEDIKLYSNMIKNYIKNKLIKRFNIKIEICQKKCLEECVSGLQNVLSEIEEIIVIFDLNSVKNTVIDIISLKQRELEDYQKIEDERIEQEKCRILALKLEDYQKIEDERIEQEKCRILALKLNNKKKIKLLNNMKCFVKLLNYNVRNEGNSFVIQMFGIDKERKTYSINVKNMKPFFYIKIDNYWGEEECSNFIGDIVFQMVKDKMKKYSISENNVELETDKMDYYFDSNVEYEIVDKRKLYGFDNKTEHQFIKFTFKSMSSFYQVKNLWYKTIVLHDKTTKKKQIEFKDTQIYEANIPTLLRFFHIRNISPCGWVRIERLNRRPTNYRKNTTCDIEGTTDIKNIYPEETMEDKVPYKICSFDIEANSSHGDFPQAKKNYSKTVNEIIDIWNESEYHILSQSEQYDRLKTLIMDGFVGSGQTDVSYIYRKKKIGCDIIEQKIEKMLNTPLKDVVYEGDGNTKLTEYYKELEDGEYDDNIYTRNKYNKAYISKTTNIFDILNNYDLMKDEKIVHIEKTFSAFLPDIEGDIVTFIGSTFWNFGEKEQYLNHCIVLGESSTPANCIIESVKTETELLLEWTKVILREDPDIIIGYNIFGFDYSFICDRAKELGCFDKFMKLSRNKDHVCVLKESTLQIASGTHTLKYIDMPGRDSIDLYNYFRREFNLESYKLDYVGGNFIGDSIKDYEVGEKTTTFITKNLSGLQLENFINFQEIGHSVDYYQDGKKFKVINVNKKENKITVDGKITLNKTKMMKWCLAKDDVTPQDIFRLTNTGKPDDKAIIAKYCVQDCNLVHYLFNKIDVLTGMIEMGNICSVPLSFIIMRGQGIKLLSFLSKQCRRMNVLMPDLDKTKGNEGFEGAIVLQPKCGLYLDEPVAVVDYSSLYPSSIISENLSHDSKVWTKEYDLKGRIKRVTGTHEYDNLPGFKFVDKKIDTFRYMKNQRGRDEKIKTGYKICRFVQFPDGELAIIPSILKELLAARKGTRNLIKYKTVKTVSGDKYDGLLKKTETEHIISNKDGEFEILNTDVVSVEDTYNDFMKNILDKRQLAYKVTANSTYGQTGAKTSSFYEPDVAASTTKTGQELLIYAKNVIEGVYGDKICETNYGKVRTHAECIYGDTDSVFMSFKLTTLDGVQIKGKEALKHSIELAKEAGQLATKFLKAPHDLEYEKTFMPFCLLSKKRYVGMLYEEDVECCKRNSMGIVLKRRDNAPIVKDVYGGVIDILMNDQDVSKAIVFLKESLNKIVNGKYPENKFIITKSLRSNYKNPHQIAHKVLANRIGQRDEGNKPKSGDRIAYMYFIQKKKVKLQGDKIETPEFIRENKLEIDYEFYITNQIMKPTLQIFALVLESIPSYKRQIKNLNLKLDTLKQTTKDEEKYIKKVSDIRNKEAMSLIFGDIMRILKNKKQGVKSLTSFFGKK